MRLGWIAVTKIKTGFGLPKSFSIHWRKVLVNVTLNGVYIEMPWAFYWKPSQTQTVVDREKDIWAEKDTPNLKNISCFKIG